MQFCAFNLVIDDGPQNRKRSIGIAQVDGKGRRIARGVEKGLRMVTRGERGIEISYRREKGM